ncbi:MAG: hypothetical protein D6720_13190, partial [Gammaproteobacteria bacterium]
MMLRPVQAAPEALAVRGPLPDEGAAADAQLAAVLLYGIEQGYITEADAAPLLTRRGLRRSDADRLLKAVADGLARTLEAAAWRVGEGIVPEGSDFCLLAIGLPDDRFYSPPSDPALTVELRAFYHEPLAIDTLPLPLGTAVCVALDLVQQMMPLLIGADMLDFLWYERELLEEAEALARETDLSTLTPDALAELIEPASDTYPAIWEILSMGNDPEWLLNRVRDLSAPPPAAKAAADRCHGMSPAGKSAMLRRWLDAWASASPSLADHPLARWVAKVVEVVQTQNAEGRDRFVRTYLPDEGEFTLPDQGILVTLGERWEDESVTHLFETL